MEGTSGQQTGIACGGTEVPMEIAREFLRAVAWEMVGEFDGN